MKVEVDLDDLETLLDVADAYVYWHPSTLEVANRIEETIRKARNEYQFRNCS